MRGLLVLATTTVVVAIGGATVARAATQVTVTASDDSYVSSSSPSSNFGSSSSLRVQSSGPTETAYLKYTVSSILGTVTEAHLHLYVTDSSSSGGTVYRVASTTWSQSSLSYRNAPALGAALANVGRVTSSRWVDIPLGTSVTGNGTYSFAIRGTTTDRAAYASRETTARPQLVVTYGPTAPANRTLPVVSGTAEELSTLSASAGTWSGYPAPTYAYQWERCDASALRCTDIAGATNTTLTLAFSDVGSTYRVRVTATNTAGTAASESLATSPVKAVSLALPVRATFYYGWYPENFVPGQHYVPTLGYYNEDDAAVIKQHIAAMQYGGIQAGLYSWAGQVNTGNNSTLRFPSYLAAAKGTGFKWAVYYEAEGVAGAAGNPAPAQIESDLKFIRDNYATSPNYLRIAGRPVVFVYPAPGDGCDMVDRWTAGNTVGDYVVLGNTWVDNAPQLASLTPYDSTFSAGVRVATGDLNGDGTAEIVTAPGAGGPATINVLSPDGTPLASFVDAASGTRGSFVAVGDVAGDATPEIVVGTGNGATPTISVYSYSSTGVTLLSSFDPGMTNAMRVAVGDVTGDGKGDIVATTGPGIPASLKVFTADGTVESSLNPFAATFTKGAYVAAADVNGDGHGEIVVADGDGAHNQVRVLDATGADVIAPFEAYAGFGGSVAVAVGDTNGDGQADIVTGASGGPHVRSFTLRLGRASGLESMFAYPSNTSGQIWVAAANVAGDKTDDIVVGSALGQPGQAKVFGNIIGDCASQPDDWHEYLVTASGESSLGSHAFTVMPGYWWAHDAAPALPRDPARWETNVQDMKASGADWQLVLSFNEWGEATAVESGGDWATASGFGTYLDLLRGVAPATGAGGTAAAGTGLASPAGATTGGSTAPAATFPVR